MGNVTFPFYFHLFGHHIHPHLVLELIAYTAGFQLYVALRRRAAREGTALAAEPTLWLIVGCVIGALVGSKILAWAESFHEYWPHRADPRAWLGGKTIVGGLLGGWIGVEIVKKRLGIGRSTGDLFVFPLIVGMSIGRVGCFLTGLDDHTHGVATSLPWGVDFGDGVRRHPTQLYDIVFLMLLATILLLRARRPWQNGRMFRWFMLLYLGWRFAVEFIKPRDVVLMGLSAIQIASLIGALACMELLLSGQIARDAMSARWDDGKSKGAVS
jgi:phosphatidylglycerol:prolipoprotein diacylglycerol transferase